MISPSCFLSAFLFLCLGSSAFAAPVFTGVTNRSRYTTTATFTVTGATSVTLDGVAVPLVGGATGSVAVISIGYHELTATDGTTTETRAFIVRNSERGSSEDGIPTMVPYRLVNDAPSAFAAGDLKILAPSTYPLNLALPVSTRLVKGASAGAAAGDPLWLNGIVSLGGSHPFQLRRGWGSTIVPPVALAGSLVLDASVNGRSAPKTVTFEASTTYVTKSGTISTAENWGSNARIHLTANLTVAAGGSVTVGPGSVIKCAQGATITVAPNASFTLNGTTENPAVFIPENAAQLWGGFWLQSGTPAATVTATGTIFCRWGNDQNWLGTAPHTFTHHKPMQPCFAVGASAVLNLTDCAMVGPIGLSDTRGCALAMDGGNLNLTRVLIQRCISGGEQVAGTVEIHSSAIMEMTQPGVDVDSGGFTDNDNDGIYLVPGSGRTYNLSKTVIGWTKDDGIDTGGDGAGFTIATNCWFENCIHEAISNSGVGRVPQTIGGVHFNNGQAMECGYGGPVSLVKDALLVGNMVGARFGDNYGSDSGTNGTGTSQYDGNITVQNSLSLNNYFHDTWAINFSQWVYQNNRLIMTGSKVSKAADLAVQNGVEDSANSLWNPVADAALIAPFMPVPGSAVGVDLLLAKRQDALAAFPASVNVRLSTFSSNEVSVTWQAVGKTNAVATVENILTSGTLTFAQGETLKTITPTLPIGHGYASVVLRLVNPANAEITGLPAYYFQAATPPPDQVFFNKASTWSYQALRAAPANDTNGKTWKDNGYLETNWQLNKTAPIGFGTIGVTGSTLTLGTTLSAGEQGSSTDRTKTVYFRKTFTVTDPSVVSGIILDHLRDDGVVYYLNGTEILRDNIDSGTAVGGVVSYSTLAAGSPADADENKNYNYPAPFNFLALLVSGTNLLAAEVHQSSVTSSDLVFDAKLTATFGSPATSPTASPESYVTNQNTPLNVAAPGLLANDTDPDAGTTLTAYVDTAPSPSVGAVSISANGSFTFAPAAAFTGSASFTYRAFDGLLVSDPVTVNITVIDTDTDDDGLLDAYEIATFGNLSQTGSGDFDGDGMDNLSEQLAGTSPLSGTSRFAASFEASIGGQISFSFPSLPGQLYTIEYKNDLGDAAWQVLGTINGTTGASTTYSDTSTGFTVRFYRVRIDN